MKTTGIVRKLDKLGRIVIPKEIQKKLILKDKDSMEIFTDGSSIVLKKVSNKCICCGSDKDVKIYKGITLCQKCIAEINQSR